MTDLHTHILPGMDDGAKTVEMSLEMLRMERDQGVTTVALTPHFYRDLETLETFLRRRAQAVETLQAAIRALPEQEQASLPRLVLGAEVAWVPNMALWPKLRELCYAGTEFILVEPPFQRWSETVLRQLYELMDRHGLIPVIAHLDRYFDQKKSVLEELFSMGLPVQLSGEALLRRSTRGKALKALKSGSAQLLISDCHNLTGRQPNLGAAMEVLRRKLGEDWAARMEEDTAEIIRGAVPLP